MLTWYQWLIAIGIPVPSIVVGYGLLSSYCRRAVVQADGLQLTTILGWSLRLPWSEVKRAELFFPFTRLVLGVKPRFWALRSAYFVNLSKLPDPDEFLAQVNRVVPIKRVRNISELGNSVAERFRK